VADYQFDSSEEYCKLSCEVQKNLTECCDRLFSFAASYLGNHHLVYSTEYVTSSGQEGLQ
jgi:hypothetical protein